MSESLRLSAGFNIRQRCQIFFRDLIFAIGLSTAKTTQTKTLAQQEFLAERLFSEYGNSLLRLAYSYLHNMSDAEEIMQDAILKCLSAAPKFTDSEHEKAWLLKVTANLSKNRIQYNSYRETDELNDELHAREENDLSFLWEAVRQLPDKYREVIHLFYQEGYSTRQISEILERKESTVRSDLKRGREALKQILKEEYDFAE